MTWSPLFESVWPKDTLEYDHSSGIYLSRIHIHMQAHTRTTDKQTDRYMAMKRPECLHSRLSEKVIRHQLKEAAVSANKKLKRGCLGQGSGGGVKSRSDRRMLGLAIQVNADGTAASIDASWWCQLNVSHVCMCSYVYAYDETKTMCVLKLNLKVRWNYTHIHTHCLPVISRCPGYEMNMEEQEQKARWHWDKVIGADRCACVSVDPCVSALCQDSRWLVKRHQWPSPYPPSTLHPLSISLFFPKSQFISPLVVSVPSLHKSSAHWEDEHIHKHRRGWFIHGPVWDAVLTQSCWIM